MATEQQLYIIIAQSDYIYGTNYQFCHGFIGKDLTNMTQQKTIQAMGRIGRGNIQQEYTVRFRDDSIIKNLFNPTVENMEAVNMNRLFCAPDGYYDDYERDEYCSTEHDSEKEIYRNGKLFRRRNKGEKKENENENKHVSTKTIGKVSETDSEEEFELSTKQTVPSTTDNNSEIEHW